MKRKQGSGFYINYWSGQKGGVGKSWITRLDAQRHVDRNIKFWLVDADKGNQSTLKFYPEFALEKDAFFSEVPELRSIANPIFEAAIERPVITNCRAGTNKAFLEWLKAKRVSEIAKQHGIRLRYFFVSDLEGNSLNLFEPTAKAFCPHMPLIFVANQGRNLSGMEFFHSKAFQALLNRYKVPVIHLSLFDLNWRKIIEGHNSERQLMSWGEARELPELGVLGRSEVQTYLEEFYGQLDNAERLADLEFFE